MSETDPLNRTSEEDEEEIWKFKCNGCLRCNERNNCEKCSACLSNRTCEKRRCMLARKLYLENSKNERKQLEKEKRSKGQTASTSTQSALQTSSNEDGEKKKRGRKKGAVTKASGSANVKAEKKEVINVSRPTRGALAEMRRKQMADEIFHEPRQCLQPDCTRQARRDSKYCSDECGKILAKMRLTEVLPSRTKEYFSTPTNHDDEMERKRAQLQKDMQELTVSEKKLVALVEKLHEFVKKFAPVQPTGKDENQDETLYEACVVCGQPDVPLRRYAKHVESCWTRSEKAISFGAPEMNNDTIYCEKFDSKTKTYCKRLKSLCPEHKRPGPEQFLKICAYPVKWSDASQSFTVSDIIESEDPFGESGCLYKKDACPKHHRWIQTLRGSIELEQACLFQKMYELCHESQKFQNYLKWSTNALNILIHKPPKIVNKDQPGSSK